MDFFEISGGVPLSGRVRAAGSKNAALPMMAASILADGPVRLRGVAQLEDVDTLSRVLSELGMSVSRLPPDTLLLETVDPAPVHARYKLVRRMRASFCVLGPLLARRGRAVVSLPGGCNIGDRPVDLHLKALAALGAEFDLRRGYVLGRAKRLRGATIDLAGPHGSTVTGTANVLSAAVLAEGETTITSAAMEPEIVDLGNFLVAMGAHIVGLGTPTIHIAGTTRLQGTSYRTIPDRVEAATLLIAAAVTGGSVTVTNVVPDHLSAVLHALRAAGLEVQQGHDYVTLACNGRPRPMAVVAEPYPGIPTDLQAQLTALACLARGRSTITDRVFPNRFLHVAELNRLGARIERRNATAVVDGVKRLTGATVDACDLRASAALVLAGLAAEDQTTVRRVHHLDRGYQRLDEKLGRLGGRIVRKRETEPRSARRAKAAPGSPFFSGKQWWKATEERYPNSTQVCDLEAGFRASVEAFLVALRDAGAKVVINSTRRNAVRAHLMHYSWRLAKGEIAAREIPVLPELDIRWDHGDEQKSRRAAAEMISPQCFNMAYPAALDSHHIAGKAIDMTITWTGTLVIRQQDGRTVEIPSLPADGTHPILHQVGRTYGAIKHPTDRPHWSVDGR